jgi:flagellar hook-associated protein 1 FlgK
MPGVRSIFDIGVGALTASELSLQTVSNNVANASTPGYSREEAVLDTATPMPSSVGLLGNGVKVSEVRRFTDQYLDDTIQKKNSDLQFQQTSEQYLQQMQSILSEDNSQLTTNITGFFNAWQDLSTDPASVSPRIEVQAQGENLASSVRTVYSDLTGLQSEINSTVGQEVDNINNLTSELADLNQNIANGGTDGQANEYLDQQTALLNQLSGELGIVSFKDKLGRVTVLTTNGNALVDDSNHWNLQVSDPNATGSFRVNWEDSNGNLSDITTKITNGTLGSLLYERDVDAQGFINQLNTLAQTITTQVNQIHQTGYNLNQTTGVAFFTPLTQNYAAGMSVSNDVQNDVNNIASTSSPDQPTDNDIALGIAGLANGNLPFTVNGSTTQTTPVDFASSMESSVGELTQNAQNLATYQTNTMSVLTQQQQSVEGVSLDEELTKLMQYQNAYQASAQLISTADNFLTTVLNMVATTTATAVS